VSAAEKELVVRMNRVFAHVQQVVQNKDDHSPYSIELIIACVDHVRAWMAGVQSSGSFARYETVLPILDVIEREANAVLNGKVEFGAQLSAHLKVIRDMIQQGVDANLLSAQHPVVLEKKLQELESGAASRSMQQNYQRAKVLERALESTLLEADAAKKLLRSGSRLR
jgi:hypothetical protein